MIYLDLHKALSAKGILDHQKFLRKCGFTAVVAHRLLNHYHTTMPYRYIETLCFALNCTPDYLFSWTPADGTTVPDNHPLNKLRPDQAVSLAQKFQQLSPEKIEQVLFFVDQISKP